MRIKSTVSYTHTNCRHTPVNFKVLHHVVGRNIINEINKPLEHTSTSTFFNIAHHFNLVRSSSG